MVHRDCMYVFGGFYGYAGLAKPNGRRNDLWRYDLTTGWWTQLGAYGDMPSARSHHSMTVVGDSVLLFGGVDEKERQVGGFGMFDTEVRTECVPAPPCPNCELSLSALVGPHRTWAGQHVVAAG